MKKCFLILAAASMLLVGCGNDEDAFVSISPETLSFDGSGSSQTIVLKSNTTWSVTNASDWVAVSPKSGTGDETVTVTVAQNEGLDRKADISFSIVGSASTLSVSQTGYPTVKVSEAALSFGATAAEKAVTITTNYDWTVSSNADWITVTPKNGSAAASAQNVTIAVSNNETYDRTGILTFSNGSASAEVAVAQTGLMIEYAGVGYHTVEMKDGRTWIVEPLQYIPSGKTPSGDPGDNNGIWYPYTSADGKTGTADKDASSIAARGYLYDYATAFGVAEVNADNYQTFEGKQGICPDGYHIPTRTELVALCGYSNKASEESDALVKADAPYYFADYKGAKITDLDADGFTWPFSGMINRTTSTRTGVYTATSTSSTNCTVDSYLNKLSVSYLMGSTGYAVNPTSGNIQFFGLMSSFTKSNTEGRAFVSYTNYLGGYTVRCIKNN